MSDIESIIARVKPTEKSVPLCLDGPLAAEYERLEVLLREAGPATSLGDESSAEAIAERMAALHEELLQARVWFRFRAQPKREWRALKGRLPVKQAGQNDDEAADEYHAWVCELVAATCYEPVMTAEQAHRLCEGSEQSEGLTDGQWAALINAAWQVNTDNPTVPFSAAASAVTRRSAGKSRRPEPSASPAPSSSAGSPAPSPSTSTTTADG